MNNVGICQVLPGNAALASGPSGLGGPEMDPAMPLIDMASLPARMQLRRGKLTFKKPQKIIQISQDFPCELSMKQCLSIENHCKKIILAPFMRI